jgi:hypothetical protein
MEIGYLKVEGEDSLVRDARTKAILNTNSKEYELYMARKSASRQQKEQLEQQAMEIKEVKNELSEIKQMLSILINKQ